MKKILIVVAILGMAENVSAQGDGQSQRQSLAGLPGLFVTVWGWWGDDVPVGITRKGLQTAAELRLRPSLKLLTQDEAMETPGVPLVHIFVSIMPGKLEDEYIPGYAYHISMKVLQGVELVRDSSMVLLACTWSGTPKFGMAPTEQSTRVIREEMNNILDEFLNAYLAANQ